MKLSIISSACLAALSLWGNVDCGNDHSMQMYALEHAIAKNSKIIRSNVYTLKELKTSSGHGYLFYFNTEPPKEHAYSILVVMDEQCTIRYVDENPRESDLKLVSIIN